MPADLRHDWRPVLPLSQRIWQCECCRVLARDVPPDTLCRVRVAAAITAAERRGYERATADAVAYLRHLADDSDATCTGKPDIIDPVVLRIANQVARNCAAAIESGAHRGAAGGCDE